MSAWRPSRGDIDIRGLVVRYPGMSRPALDHVSLTIPAGQRVAITGRTGCGKSTLLASIYRLVPLEGGSIHIDGLDTASIPIDALRTGLAAIPQQAFLFTGTVRSNLDPAGTATDAALLDALRACRLRRPSTPAPAGAAASPPAESHIHLSLDDAVEEGGRNFSVGERQLLTVCRALVQRSRIVCVDEAVANADDRTDAVIRSVLADAFGGCTQVIVAHRIATVLACDHVVLLQDGRVVESGPPAALRAQAGGQFAALCAAAGAGGGR